MEASEKWEPFVTRHLLSKHIVDGVALLTPAGLCIYSHGNIESVAQKTWNTFKSAAEVNRSHKTSANNLQDLVLNLHTRGIKYRVYQQTYSSLYAIAEGGKQGLVVCFLPYGCLVCTHSQTHKVVEVIEEFCDLLRA